MTYQDTFQAWGGSTQVARMAERSAHRESPAVPADHDGGRVPDASRRRIIGRAQGSDEQP
jgi:hypothetical protein